MGGQTPDLVVAATAAWFDLGKEKTAWQMCRPEFSPNGTARQEKDRIPNGTTTETTDKYTSSYATCAANEEKDSREATIGW